MIEQINQVIRKNTVTNYISVGMRLLQGILVNRWLYLYLGKEHYGFWALLWSIFFYVLVLDFGFSKAAQKSTAEGLAEHDLPRYLNVVSTVFSLQCLMSIVIVAGTLACTWFLPQLTMMEAGSDIAYCRRALMLFGIGIACTFPTGIFPEILIGLKAVYLRNYVLIGGRIIELLGNFLLFYLGGRLIALVVFTIAMNVSLNMVMFMLIRREIPGFALRFSLRRAMLRELADFSLFTYLTSLASLLIRRTDRLVLSVLQGLSMVGIYQLGTRIPDILESMTMQYQDNVAPFTADLHRRGDIATLREIVLNGVRLTVFLAAGGGVFALVATPEMLLVLFGTAEPEVVYLCRITLVNVFLTVSIRSFAVRMLMMSGHHRVLCGISWIDAFCNISLTLFLLKRIGVPGVVFGTLIPNALITLLVLLPYVARIIQFPLYRLVWRYYLLLLLNTLPAAVAVSLLRRELPEEWSVFLRFGLMTLVGGCIYLGCSWYAVFTGQERRNMAAMLDRRRKAVHP